jgi:catalase
LYEGEHYHVTGELLRAAASKHAEDDDHVQPRALWENVLSDTDRAHMISNIVGHASAPEVTDDMKKRVVEYWTNIHKDLGHGVSQGLALS